MKPNYCPLTPSCQPGMHARSDTFRSRFGLLVLWLSLLCGHVLHAQPATPLRIAILSGNGTPTDLADLLTVELSQKPALQLVERDQVRRILREQSVSAQGRDPVKLGQLLKADGLLLLDPSRQDTNRFLHARLIAVRSGVLLGTARTPDPVADPVRWAAVLAARFDPLFAKLGVTVDDAIPLSIVNLRAAVSSQASRELERQLTLLAIERLSMDRRLFVLERRRLDLLAEEKELQPADETFWNGRYLLEGTIDRDGTSTDTISLDLRLTGPGGIPTSDISLKGPRDQLPALVDRLATRVLEVLLRPVEPVVWKPDAEATRFLDEARWAARWELWPEARAASDAAWALGRQDAEAALVRVRALLPELAQTRKMHWGELVDGDVANLEGALRDVFNSEPGALPRILTNGNRLKISFTRKTPPPTPAQIAQATRALGLYNQFSATLPPTEPTPASDWYLAGVETLMATGPILQGARLNPALIESQKDELAALRSEARRTEDRLLASTSVRAEYWPKGSALQDYDAGPALAHSTNIFQTLVAWGPFWRETPDDCVGLWRTLMSSPVFSFIHGPFWVRKHDQPQVLAWTPADRARAHGVWQSFVSELAASTNFLHRMEAKALEVAGSYDWASREARFNELLGMFQTHRDDFIRHPVNLLGGYWGILALADLPVSERTTRTLYLTGEARALIVGIETEWRNATRGTPARPLRPSPATPPSALAQAAAAAPSSAPPTTPQAAPAASDLFARRKAFLQATTPGSAADYDQLFNPTELNLTPAQAQELRPLVDLFMAHLVAQIQAQGGVSPTWGSSARAGIQLRTLGTRLDMIVRSGGQPPQTAQVPSPTPLPSAPPQRPMSFREFVGAPTNPIPPAPRSAPAAGSASESMTNFPVLTPSRFVGLTDVIFTKRPRPFNVMNLALHDLLISEDSLWADARFSLMELVNTGRAISNQSTEYAAWAKWDPKAGNWVFIGEMVVTQPNGPVVRPSSCQLGDILYVSDWNSLRTWSSAGAERPAMRVPWQAPPVLFALHKRLYGISKDAIYEIPTDGGTVRILASTRRRPATTPLDSLEKFENLQLIEGPEDSILVAAGERLHRWDGKSWSVNFPHPVSFAQAHAQTVLLSGFPERATSAIWLWQLEKPKPTLALAWNRNDYGELTGQPHRPRPAPPTFEPGSGPAWKIPYLHSGLRTSFLPLGSDLVVYVDRLPESGISYLPIPEDHGILTVLSPGDSNGRSFRVRYDTSKGRLPCPDESRRAGADMTFRRLAVRAFRDQILVYHPAQAGFWVIPRKDLTAGPGTRNPARSRP